MDNLEDSTNRIDNSEGIEMNDERCSSSTLSNVQSSFLKKRKLSNDGFQDEYDTLKLEIDDQRETICAQAKMIRELQKERDNLAKSVGVNKNMNDKPTIEEELRSQNAQLQKLIEDSKIAIDNQAIDFEKQNEAAQKRIKDLEAELSFVVKDGKHDLGCIENGKLKQDMVNDLQSACDKYCKEINDLKARLKLNNESETYLRKRVTEMEQVNNHQINLYQAKIDSLKKTIEDQEKKLISMEEAKKKAVDELQFELDEMQKCYKDEVKTNIALQDEYDKAMADMKIKMQTKINTDKIKYEAEIKRLNATNQDLLKAMSENRNVIANSQNVIDEPNAKITVAKTKEAELHSKINDAEKKELDTRAVIIDDEVQILDLVQTEQPTVRLVKLNDQTQAKPQPTVSFIELDDQPLPQPAVRYVELFAILDGSNIAYDRFLNRNITVIKIRKLTQINVCDQSDDDDDNVIHNNIILHSRKKSVRANLSKCLKKNLRVQINGEFKGTDFNNLSEIMPIIYSCNLSVFDLGYNDLIYENFMKLVSSRTIKTYKGGFIERNFNDRLSIDEIMKELPNIENLDLKCHNVLTRDCRNLLELPAFLKLRQCKLYLTAELFDFMGFANFVKKHQTAKFTFCIDPSYKTAASKLNENFQKMRKSLPLNCKVFCTS